MKTKLFVFFCFLIITLNQGCHNSQNGSKPATSDPNYHKIDFASFIDKHKNDTLTFYEELLGNKQFVDILEHSEFYLEDVRSFLGKGNFNDLQVAICICAMQNLKVSNYVKLCNLILILYNNNKVSEGILEHAISPDFLRKRIIIYNYNNSDVMKLLKNIQNDQKLSNRDFKKWLPDILSGKSSKELKDFDKGNSN